jgi:uncharacterized protein with von Willebrand factor type A (vWA) domain
VIRNNNHFLENILVFSRLLRQAGLPVTLEQTMDFARALTLIDIGDPEQVYFAARDLLVSRQEHLRLFDLIFDRFWHFQGSSSGSGGQKAPIAPRYQPETHRSAGAFTLLGYMARAGDPEIDVTDKSETYSAVEVLQQKQFSEMTPEELDTIKKIIQVMQWQVSLRQTRRRVSDPRGKVLHLRRVMRSAAKHGGVAWNLSWQNRKIKQRPVVLIADISGSMERYSRLLLQFFYSVTHSLRDVESFVFGTRLSRLTAQLKLKNIDRAIEQTGHEVVDWSGGTRIGECLRSFNRQWSRRVVRRGAVVIIVSDGWERGDVSVLKQEMRYLKRRCHRLIWLNPLLGNQGYQPLVEGMAAALPYIDDFLPIHNLQSLRALSDHLAKLGPNRLAQPLLRNHQIAL